MAPQGGKKKTAKTHIRKGETGKNFIDSLANEAAGIRQVNPTTESRWTPEEDTTMTRDIGSKLENDFSLPGTKPAQPSSRPAQPRRAPHQAPRQATRTQQQRSPANRQNSQTRQNSPHRQPTRPLGPQAGQKKKKPPAPPQSKSKEIVAKAKIISEKFKRGELSKEHYKSMRGKLTGMVEVEIMGVKKKISILENKFLNNQVSMKKYNLLFDSLNKELNRLSELRDKVSPK